MKRIGLLIFPQVQSLDVCGPLDVFAEANAVTGKSFYDLHVISTVAGPILASNGMTLLPNSDINTSTQELDLLLVAGGPGLPDEAPAANVTEWLKSTTKKTERFGSICNGAFLLGYAGLLDNKVVTTHWQDAASLAKKFPLATVELDRIYARDGQLFTSAGVTAGIDLCLMLVAEDLGAEIAQAVAKRLVVFVQRQGGQSQFSTYLTALHNTTSPLAELAAFIQKNISSNLSIDIMAKEMQMSQRSFIRAFSENFIVTPAEFVEGVRIDAARQLLERDTLPLKTIAYQVGFNSAERMRQVFMRKLGVSPKDYRQRFSSSVKM